ncbi:MAG: hypothetical protein ABR606_19845 [Vicinamibacterales bacterium]
MVRSVVVALLALLALPTSVPAWGFDAHRFITERALALLPPELRPFFEHRRAFVVERSVDPDLWRSAGFDREPPNHFVDLDYEQFGPDPFAGLPRDFDAAVQKFGPELVAEQGTLPWRAQEFYGRLQRSFEALERNPPSAYALDDIAFFAAVLAHYIEDAHVPLHAVVNYDGQLTKQRGLHARWETDLFERVREHFTMAPRAPQPMINPRDTLFDTLLASNRLVPGLLEADRRAAAGREHYDEEYFAAFAASQGPVLERRVNDAATAVASAIVGAWHQAGRPAVPVTKRVEPKKIGQ